MRSVGVEFGVFSSDAKNGCYWSIETMSEPQVVEHGGQPVQVVDEDKYVLCIEGKDYPWDDDKVTTAQIAKLGGWDSSEGVIEVDENNVERTLDPEEVVYLKPGIQFGKKLRFKRG